MSDAGQTLIQTDQAARQQNTGILSSQVVRELVRVREIEASAEIVEDQIQPASLDLRLGGIAYRVQASFLPGPNSRVEDKLGRIGMHEIDLSNGAVLEKGCVYIVPLMERLRLSSRISGIANPKSSTGRLNIFTRLITDRAVEFDRVATGYEGPLYAEISPGAFSILVRQGSRLNQLRLRRGSSSYSDSALKRLHAEVGLVDSAPGTEIIANGRLAVAVDLLGDPTSGLIGWRAKRHTGIIDIDVTDRYDPEDYWEPIRRVRDGALVLNPDDFYILASKEAITVPPDHAAEMVAYDTVMGEFRVHYAGFFDPGFGHPTGGASGTKAVLEVRSHDVPFLVEDAQVVGSLVYERLTAPPDKLYGAAIGSSYQRQGLALAKQFRAGDRP